MMRRLILGLSIVLACPVSVALDIVPTYFVQTDFGFLDDILGDARRTAFERALQIWAQQLDGTIEVKVHTHWTNDGTESPAAARPTTYYSEDGLPALTWYASALASQLVDFDLPVIGTFNNGHHIEIVFNEFTDRISVPVGGGRFYYGLDSNPPGADLDFVSVVLHELTHGFGMDTVMNMTGNGAPCGSFFAEKLDIMAKQLRSTFEFFPFAFVNLMDFERCALLDSGLVYWKGTALMGASEYSTSVFPQKNDDGEIQMFTPVPFNPGVTMTHLAMGNAQPVLMKGLAIPPPLFSDVAEAKGILLDLGWEFLAAPTSGAIAWVDFDHIGAQHGTQALPFSSLGGAQFFLLPGGTINIQSGSSDETLTVNKVMTVNAIGGPATIGLVAR